MIQHNICDNNKRFGQKHIHELERTLLTKK